jgi:hypothetical protein|tara:strand:+ start:5796 stop:6080 length:285 start_codon:yes stop_codon:yes gene_type:complete
MYPGYVSGLYMYLECGRFKKGGSGVNDERKNDESAEAAPEKPLSPAARRALAEAEERRRLADAAPSRPREINGRGGAEPTRYGDWEVKGIVSDF